MDGFRTETAALAGGGSRHRSRATQRRIRRVPRSPMQESLPLMCRRGSQTLLPPTPQNRAVAVELMTVTFRNGTRSSALSAVAMARFSFRSPRRAHVGRERWPLAQIALRGLWTGSERVYRTRDEGARYGQAVTLTVTLGSLRGGQFDAGRWSGVYLPTSPFTAPQRDDRQGTSPLPRVLGADSERGPPMPYEDTIEIR